MAVPAVVGQHQVQEALLAVVPKHGNGAALVVLRRHLHMISSTLPSPLIVSIGNRCCREIGFVPTDGAVVQLHGRIACVRVQNVLADQQSRTLCDT